MRTNANLTLYNKYVDPATRSEKYQRRQIVGVTWENRKAANVLASGGNLTADQAAIYIPMQRGADYLKPVAWQGLPDKTSKWTLQAGDVVVRGLVSDELTEALTVSDLKRKYDDVLIISSVDTMDQGSFHLQHWQVGAR